jgi:GNAT superfamily N-acetyltransferase
MVVLPFPYSVRLASPADARTISFQRALMFMDMGSMKPNEVDGLRVAGELWFRRQLITTDYVGWLVMYRDEIVAGGGIQLREIGPAPDCHRIRRSGHIENIYTTPAHRRRGLASTLMATILEWSENRRLDQVTLTASTAGRPLYESMGFVATTHMEFIPRAKLKQYFLVSTP